MERILLSVCACSLLNPDISMVKMLMQLNGFQVCLFSFSSSSFRRHSIKRPDFRAGKKQPETRAVVQKSNAANVASGQLFKGTS